MSVTQLYKADKIFVYVNKLFVYVNLDTSLRTSQYKTELCPFFCLFIDIYIYSRMGAPGSPNNTFYNSWAPPLGAPL